MIDFVLINDVETSRVKVVDRFVELKIGVQVKIAILMALLTYDSFNDYKSFGLKHLRNGLSRCWALRICQEYSFSMKSKFGDLRDHILR